MEELMIIINCDGDVVAVIGVADCDERGGADAVAQLATLVTS